MTIMDDIRKMMAQRAAQGIGTGGGLFGTTNTQGQPTGLLGGLRNINPNLLIGAAITGAGMRGQDPFSSILPATLQAAQISKYLTPKDKRTPLQKNLESAAHKNKYLIKQQEKLNLHQIDKS